MEIPLALVSGDVLTIEMVSGKTTTMPKYAVSGITKLDAAVSAGGSLTDTSPVTVYTATADAYMLRVDVANIDSVSNTFVVKRGATTILRRTIAAGASENLLDSARGPQGDTGVQGPQGAQGTPGAAGTTTGVTDLSFAAATELTIASGAITITQGNHTVDTEGDAASDTLTTINGTASERLLLLRPANTGRRVILDGTISSNIRLPNGLESYLIPSGGVVALLYDGAHWVLIGTVGAPGRIVVQEVLSGIGDTVDQIHCGERLSLASTQDGLTRIATFSAPRWVPILINKVSDTPPSTSTITTVVDLSATIKVGAPLRYKVGANYRIGIVTAVTSDLITVMGEPLTTGAGDLTELYYGAPEMVGTLSMAAAGVYADATDTDLLANHGKGYHKWTLARAHVVGLSAAHQTVDTTAQPKVNLNIGGAAVSTNDSNNGVQLSGTAGTWVDNPAVAINTTNNVLTYGAAITPTCTVAAGTKDAANLTVLVTYVME